MASAGTVTVDGTGTDIFSSTKGCTEFSVEVPSTSAQDALINIMGLHEDGDFFVVPKGKSAVFRLGNMGIKKVFAKGSGGNATINYGVLSRTYGV